MDKNIDFSKDDSDQSYTISYVFLALIILIVSFCICGIILSIRHFFPSCRKPKLTDDTKHLMLVRSDNSESY